MRLERPDGVGLWWESEGSGPPVVMVPGRGDATDVFPRQLTDGLVACGLRTVRYDPRDAGLSDTGGDTYTLSTMADDAVAVLDAAAGPQAAAHWVGVSMGGLQLVDLAARHADRVATLTFVAAMSPDPAAGFGDAFFAEPPADPADARVAALGDVDDDDRAWVRDEVARAAERAPARPGAAEAHMAAAMRLGWPALESLADIHVPALVVHGDRDRTLPLAHAEALADGIRGAEVMIRHGMGHLPRPGDWDVIAREVLCQAVSTQ